MPPLNIGEEFSRLGRTITESMSVDMPMAVLNQLKLITVVMRRSS